MLLIKYLKHLMDQYEKMGNINIAHKLSVWYILVINTLIFCKEDTYYHLK